MTKAIDLAKQCGIAYYLTPEGTTEMHGTDRQIEAFAELVAEAEREARAKVDDAMIDAYMEFAKKTTHLHHPAVPYNGTINGDSQDSWMRRLVKALLEHAIRARVNK